MPSTIKIIEPNSEPVTLDEAKLHLKVDHDEEDALISGYISTARELCETECQRTIMLSTWEMTTDIFDDALKLDWPRVLRIDWLKYLDEDGIERAIDPQDFRLDARSDITPAYLVPARGRAWPGTDPESINCVTVRYAAGYGSTPDSVPWSIRHWVMLHVADFYKNREVTGHENKVLPYHDGLLRRFKVYG